MKVVESVMRWGVVYIVLFVVAYAVAHRNWALAIFSGGSVYLMGCEWIVNAIQESHKVQVDIQADIRSELRKRTDTWLDDYLNAYLKANQEAGQ